MFLISARLGVGGARYSTGHTTRTSNRVPRGLTGELHLRLGTRLFSRSFSLPQPDMFAQVQHHQTCKHFVLLPHGFLATSFILVSIVIADAILVLAASHPRVYRLVRSYL